MDDLFDAGPAIRDLSRQIGETARAIADGRGKTAQSAVRNQTSLDHPTEYVGVDIASGEDDNHAFAGEVLQLPAKTSGERRCCGAFHHALFTFDGPKNRNGDLFLGDNDSLIDKRSCDL